MESSNRSKTDWKHERYDASVQRSRERAKRFRTGSDIEVEPLYNGPLMVTGNVEIVTGTGHTVRRITRAQLCRCGGSRNKPFCDGTHSKIGFKAPA